MGAEIAWKMRSWCFLRETRDTPFGNFQSNNKSLIFKYFYVYWESTQTKWENKLALLRRLPLSEAERIAMKSMLSIDLDPLGDEILAGLTFDESAWLLKYRKASRWNLDISAFQGKDRHRALQFEQRHRAARTTRLNAQPSFAHDLID